MIYDISMLIHEDVQVYKNKLEKKPVFKTINDLDQGGSYETVLTMNLHTGTHLDYPLHMIKDGKTSEVEKLERLITHCKVFDLTEVKDSIGEEDLIKYDIEKNDFILLKTKNSFSDSFDFNFIYLNESGAKYLASKNINGVGIDGLGIERAQPEHQTHHLLLANDIIIIEGLRLKEIKENTYEMICLPLKIKAVEATPARIILKD